MYFEKLWFKNLWKLYNDFLKIFGFYVIIVIMFGLSIKQMVFVKSFELYSQRDFQVKSCVLLVGFISVGKVGVKVCVNFSMFEIFKVIRMNMKNIFIVRGGIKEICNVLFYFRMRDQIIKLMNEVDQIDVVVEYSFRLIWNILQSCYCIGLENYVRVVNFQYYYLGYLNYGC